MTKYVICVTVLVCVLCQGCALWPDYIRPVEKMPVISQDEKPSFDLSSVREAAKTRGLSPEEKKLLDTTYELVRYAKIRDARIEAYNTYAEERNKLYREQGAKLRK